LATGAPVPGAADLNPWQEIDMGNPTCSIEGCDNGGPLVRTWCSAHYQRNRAHGSPTGTPASREKKTCKVDGCDRSHHSGGYCRPHYVRVLKAGDPGPVEIGVRHGVWVAGGTEGTCRSCGETKPADDFYLRSANPEHPNYERRFAQCKDCIRADAQDWRNANPEIHRERKIGYQLKRNYGIDRDQYDALLAAQGGRCAICGCEPGPEGKRPHVDHDHDTGAVRGVLCTSCNTAIGKFGEDVHLMARAAGYLCGRLPKGGRSRNSFTEGDLLRLLQDNPWLSCTPRRRSELRCFYRMTESDLHRMFAMQRGRCATCSSALAQQNLAVDHDHITGRVRGLLCSRCNLAIGSLKDDPKVIRSAIRYLARRR
jgi:hypothetical protein